MWHSGDGAPASSLGRDGDLYLDTTASEYYGPKQNGAWGEGVSMIGTDGAEGAVGPQGPQGIQGPRGEQGPAGADGAALLAIYSVSGPSITVTDRYVPSTSIAWCSGSDIVVSGGLHVSAGNSHYDLPLVTESRPSEDLRGWRGSAVAKPHWEGQGTVQAHALCQKTSATGDDSTGIPG